MYFLAISCIIFYSIYTFVENAPDYFEGLSVLLFGTLFMLLAIKEKPEYKIAKSVIPFWLLIIVGISCIIIWINHLLIVNQSEIFDYTMLGVLIFGIATIIMGTRELKANLSRKEATRTDNVQSR